MGWSRLVLRRGKITSIHRGFGPMNMLFQVRISTRSVHVHSNPPHNIHAQTQTHSHGHIVSTISVSQRSCRVAARTEQHCRARRDETHAVHLRTMILQAQETVMSLKGDDADRAIHTTSSNQPLGASRFSFRRRSVVRLCTSSHLKFPIALVLVRSPRHHGARHAVEGVVWHFEFQN